MNARCAVSIDESRAEKDRALGYLSTLHPMRTAACADPMRMARNICQMVEALRTKLAKYQPRTAGAARTMPVECDLVQRRDELLAGYEVDEDGTVGLTHLWINGADIYLFALEMPMVVEQIEAYIAKHETPEDV